MSPCGNRRLSCSLDFLFAEAKLEYFCLFVFAVVMPLYRYFRDMYVVFGLTIPFFVELCHGARTLGVHVFDTAKPSEYQVQRGLYREKLLQRDL